MDILRACRGGAALSAAAASRVDDVFRRHPLSAARHFGGHGIVRAAALRQAVIAGIVFGALCDLVLPAPFACLYTIAFTLAALLISTVVSNLLQQGFARALLSTVLAFLLVDLLQAFALLPRSGSAAILPMLHLFARETALSCLLLVPVYPALRAVRRAFPD